MIAWKQESPTKQGVLLGLNVVEIGHYVASPFLGMLLADQGASVIKVADPRDLAWCDDPAAAVWHRGKRIVQIDLRTAAGQAQVRRLIEQADVVIENFRPGSAERMGIDYATVRAYRPSVIYCSLPGYGYQENKRSRQGWDPVIMAETGVHQASVRDRRPQYNSLPYASMFAAIAAAGAIAAALIARRKNGEGQRVEVPLHNAMLILLGRYLAQNIDREMVEELFVPILPMRGRYRCADGRYVQNHGPYAHFVRATFTVFGHPEWIDEGLLALKTGLTEEQASAWRQRIEAVFLQRSAYEWEELLSAAGAACCVVRSCEEWMTLPHARDVAAIVAVDDPRWGKMLQPGIAVHLTGTPGGIAYPAPGAPDVRALDEPALDAWVDAMRAQAERFDHRVCQEDGARAQELPLAGVKVLDLCIVVAGPACGRALAEYGADVVKIDSPWREESATIALDVNRGKSSILLDLKTEAGRSVFWRMVDDADVIVENYRPGKLAALGLGYEDVRKRKPDIIYASLNAYGFGGAFSERPGWETIAQAMTGMQLRRGGKGPPLTQAYPFNDYGTGMLTAYGIMLALYHRSRTGQGQWLWGSLVTTASLLQSRFLHDFPGCRRFDVEGPAMRGESALSRIYDCSDGALYLHASRQRDWQALTAMTEFGQLREDPRFRSAALRQSNDWELSFALGSRFIDRPRSYWLECLASRGISAGEILSLFEVGDDPVLRQSGALVQRPHPGIGNVRHTAPVIHMSGKPLAMGRPSPRWGADGKDILSRLGYTQADIDELLKSRICVLPSEQE